MWWAEEEESESEHNPASTIEAKNAPHTREGRTRRVAAIKATCWNGAVSEYSRAAHNMHRDRDYCWCHTNESSVGPAHTLIVGWCCHTCCQQGSRKLRCAARRRSLVARGSETRTCSVQAPASRLLSACLPAEERAEQRTFTSKQHRI